MTYSAEFGGYIADVPKVIFRRCDKTVFALDELSSASVTADQGTIDINGGWSL